MTFLPALKLYKLVSALPSLPTPPPPPPPATPSSLDQALQGLPTITHLALRWPSHRCFTSSPLPFSPPNSVYFACLCVFFPKWKFWGRLVLPVPGRSGDVAACRAMCSLFSAGVWSQMEQSHQRLTQLKSAQRAHTRDERRLPTIDHIHWASNQSRPETLYFPRSCCQFGRHFSITSTWLDSDERKGAAGFRDFFFT